MASSSIADQRRRAPQPSTARRRRSWLALAALSVAGLLVTGYVFFAWLRSDGDLDGLRRELEAERVPTRWEDLDLHLSPPAALATWKRVGELSKLLKPYASQYPAFAGTTAALTPFSPVPDAARIQHAMLDQDRLDELRACVDALGDQRLELRTSSDFRTRFDEIGTGREVTNLLRDEALLAAPQQAAEACRRLLRFTSIQPRGPLISHLVRLSATEIAFAAIAGRIDILKRSPLRIDDAVETLATGAVDDLPDMESRELLNTWTGLTSSRGLDGQLGFTDLRWLDHLLDPVVLRAGRAGLLRYQADRIHRYAQALGEPTPELLLRELERAARSARFLPTGFLIGLLGGSDAMIVKMSYECRLHGLLLLAELRGTPWPCDPFDPSHSRLRALIRAGRTVGAYHIGGDGVDHLGRKPDRYYPLLERLDPLKPPPP